MVTLYWSLSASGSALSTACPQELPLFEVRARELQHLADQRGSCGPLGSTHSKLLRGSRSATRREAGSERLAPSCHWCAIIRVCKVQSGANCQQPWGFHTEGAERERVGKVKYDKYLI